MAALPVILIASMVILDQRQRALEDFAKSTAREIHQIDRATQIFFEGISKNANYLANLEQVRSANGKLKSYQGPTPELLPPSEYGERLSGLFKELAQAHPEYSFITLGSADGGATGWPISPLKNYDPRIRPWYKTALTMPEHPVRTNAYEWKEGNVALVSTVKVVRDLTGEISGVLDIDVSLKQLTDMVQKTKIGNSGYLILIEENGTILADARSPENSFKSLGDLDDQHAKLGTAKDGLIELQIHGETYLASIITSKEFGWRFVGLIEKKEVMMGASRMAWKLTILAAVLILLFVYIGNVLSKRIVEPIQSVTVGLEGLANGDGDLSRSLNYTGEDEVASLSKWFNSFLGIIRQLVERIVGASTTLNDKSSQMVQFATHMNEAAHRQKESLELVSTAFNEMVATANEVAKSCASAANSADVGQEQVLGGQEQIVTAAASVGQLSVSLSQATEALEALKQDSQNINTILDTIRSIADQTNLLALNAAIEAARAGEQGRGFSVVADEVRALARRTADSTGQIGEVLGGLVARTNRVTDQMQASLLLSQSSVDGIELAKASFQRIQESVDDIRDKNLQIAAATEEQHQVAEEINRHIGGVFDDALTVVELASKSHAESQHLTNISNDLHELIGRYRT
ncbi:Methyl-accepting chemotaxis protein (MCP) signaling domain protein [compost metagenome]